MRRAIIFWEMFLLAAVFPLSGSCFADDESDSYTEQMAAERTAAVESAGDEDAEMDRGGEPPTEDIEADNIGREQRQEEAAAGSEAAADEDTEADRGDQDF
ncbi:MAG: hypothetical protein WC592_06455 [Candidatus Omnitrophota bacterium]|nr:hypothetical protein [Candidatus Omnitrophota bacterium]